MYCVNCSILLKCLFVARAERGKKGHDVRRKGKIMRQKWKKNNLWIQKDQKERILFSICCDVPMTHLMSSCKNTTDN